MPAVQNAFKAQLIKHHQDKYELCVTGDVTEPTTGWTVTLERANPQGINPKDPPPQAGRGQTHWQRGQYRYASSREIR